MQAGDQLQINRSLAGGTDSFGKNIETAQKAEFELI
jgi:hypothetical protein